MVKKTSKTKNEPWAPAQPGIIKGINATIDVFDENQPRLQDMSNQTYEAFNAISPEAFQTSPFVQNAQNAAGAIGGGGLLGSNPGASTYARLQGQPSTGMRGFNPMPKPMADTPGGEDYGAITAQLSQGIGPSNGPTGSLFGGGRADPNAGLPMDQRTYRPGSWGYQSQLAKGMIPNGSGGGFGGDPSMGLLSNMANDNRPGAGTSLINAGASGSNPGDAFAGATAGGQYLNAQPSAGLYGEMMDRSYSTNNPYVDDIIRQNDENVTTQANRLFGSRGMGSGISSAFADVLSKNLADTGGQIRYQNYSDAENRRLQAGGQSDAAFANERGNMMNATGLLSSNFNAGQDRALAAGQALNSFDSANAAQRLGAAQSLGGQFNAGQDRSLDAARSADAAQQSQVQQMLTALGLTGDLRAAEYSGIGPALALLNTAADIPYVGVGALNGNIRQASNGYGTTTTTTNGGLGGALLGAGAQLGSAYLGNPNTKLSDRRAKANIVQISEFGDGLGVYEFDYIDRAHGDGRQIGVMADEVAALRPWALGPITDDGYLTVDYSKLEAA